jgi:polyferredoxin
MLRWVALSGTLVYLGFVDGGFLSVSHLTSGIWVGPSVYLSDLPLLLLVVFTVVTTLIWGRVFCGFLCPFGALQDFLDRVVPKRFKRSVPRRAHELALNAKYGILALILIPALAGSHASIYQYFEPFGTVFFLGSSALLWTIAVAFLVASAIVPRFYCRYVCPLGAALALMSLVSLRRIRRVEQCDHCKVCEQTCPTGAIRGPEIDFKECVRCNVCEIQLIERSGVCRHEIEDVRPRLVQLKAGTPAGAADGR